MSFGNESAHDSAAKDLRPDLYVMHIIGGTIREPSASDVLDMDSRTQTRQSWTQFSDAFSHSIGLDVESRPFIPARFSSANLNLYHPEGTPSNLILH